MECHTNCIHAEYNYFVHWMMICEEMGVKRAAQVNGEDVDHITEDVRYYLMCKKHM